MFCNRSVSDKIIIIQIMKCIFNDSEECKTAVVFNIIYGFNTVQQKSVIIYMLFWNIL